MKWTDFDIGIGWQSKGNCGSWRVWALSVYHNQNPGELTKNLIGMFIITVLGFYFRVYVMGPDFKSNQWMKNNE